MKSLIISLLLALCLAGLSISVSLAEDSLVKADTGDEKKVKALNLFDIDDVVSDIAAKKDLKLAATMLSKNSLTYNIRGHMDRKLTLKVNKSKDSYDVHLDDEANAVPLSLNVPNKAYYASEIKNFLDSNISKTAKPIARKLTLSTLIKNVAEKISKTGAKVEEVPKDSGKAVITPKGSEKKVYMIINMSDNQTKCELSTWKDGENNKSGHHKIHTFKAKGNGDEEKIADQILLFFEGEKEELLKDTETYAKLDAALAAKCEKKTDDLQRCVFTIDGKGASANSKSDSKTQAFYILDMGNGKSKISLEKSDENLLIEIDNNPPQSQVDEIKKSLEAAANANVTIENLEQKIRDAITKSDEKCNFPDLDKITKDKTYAFLKIEAKSKPKENEEPSCIMAESQLTITVYNVKPLNHMHLKLDNEYLAIEAVLNINDEKFNEKVKKYTDSFSGFTKKISGSNSEGADMDKITAAKVVEALNNEYGKGGKNGSVTLPCTFNNTVCQVDIGNQKYDLINVIEVDSEIRISMMSPISNDSKGSYVPNHPTIILKTLNGYNQLDVVLDDIKQFIQECNSNGGIGINKGRN